MIFGGGGDAIRSCEAFTCVHRIPKHARRAIQISNLEPSHSLRSQGETTTTRSRVADACEQYNELGLTKNEPHKHLHKNSLSHTFLRQQQNGQSESSPNSRRRNNKMGFDLFTVQDVPEGVFEKTREEKGYYHHGGGITRALELVGVDLQAKALRVCGFAPNEKPNLCPLAHAMCWNNGLLVTPEECRDIASKMTAEAFDKLLVGQYQCPPDLFPYDDDSKEFLLSFAKYCEQASAYGGFYIY
jgi:hypothetical protein